MGIDITNMKMLIEDKILFHVKLMQIDTKQKCYHRKMRM